MYLNILLLTQKQSNTTPPTRQKKNDYLHYLDMKK